MGRLRESFRPEFLNRIDEIIIFASLDEAQLRQITSLLLEETSRRLHAQAITVEFTTEAIEWLAGRGFQPEFGARPLRRTIQREVDNRLSAMLLDGRLAPHQHVTVAREADALAFRVTDLDPAARSPRSPAASDRRDCAVVLPDACHGRCDLRPRVSRRAARRSCPAAAGRRRAGRLPAAPRRAAAARPARPTGWRRSAPSRP